LKIHPSEERLEELFLSTGGDRQALVQHLIQCASCRERLLRLPRPGTGGSRYTALDYGEAFDAAARTLCGQAAALACERDSAIEQVGELTAAQPAEREAMLREERYQTWGVFELLVDRAQETSVADPVWAQELAVLALSLSERLSPALYRPELVEDLRARAWAYLGNARRLTSDLRGAAEAFAAAEERLRKGTGDPVERAIVLDRRASLERDLRHFGEARATLERAVSIFLRTGESHRAGRSLINLSLVHSYAGEVEESIDALYRSLSLIDPEQEPRTVLCARHNLAGYLAEAGRSEEALHLYRSSRSLYRAFPDAWTQNRRKWLKGRINHGLGRRRAAEAFLTAARDGFLAEGIPYDTALVSLDLALLYAEQGRSAELKRLAAGMVPLFASCHIHREALAALAFLQHAVETETASREVVCRVAAYLRKAQHDPELRWEMGGVRLQ
jgi:tetratricopeptide (TPR) repeat protein